MHAGDIEAVGRCAAPVNAPREGVRRTASGWRGTFEAMASPCELLLEGGSAAQACELLAVAQAEARRIERKFSRYRSDSVVAALHAASGRAVRVDDETAGLLDFAAHCHALSGGLFDITSGVLRRAWRFDGGHALPSPAQVAALRGHIGWGRVRWQRPWIALPAGMEIDFGGLGKEYAVDRTLAQLRQRTALPLLVNFGGDLAASGARRGGLPWCVGIERPDAIDATAATGAIDAIDAFYPVSAPGAPAAVLQLRAGALATSGDARRFIEVDGVRYGHILNPHTGWPMPHAPRAVTVAAPTCTEAGMLSTLAMLQGAHAEAWLAGQGAAHWVWRDVPSPLSDTDRPGQPHRSDQ